jgi:YVTN family beta-propeller protein
VKQLDDPAGPIRVSGDRSGPTWRAGRIVPLAAALAAFGVACGAHAQPWGRDPQYAIVSRLALGGDGGWDYLTVDPSRGLLFVTHGSAVHVVGTADGRLRGTVSGVQGAHGVAIAGGTGFISNGRSNSVTVFDLESLRTVDTVPVTGRNPDAIVYEPTQARVYTMNRGSGDITVIDAATHRVVGTIDGLEELEFAVTDGKGRLFVNGEARSELGVVDVRAGRMTARWKLGNCLRPTGLAIDTEHGRLFSVCANRTMVVVDAGSGRIVAELPIGARPDAAAFDPALGMVYSSNGDGSLTVVHEDDAEHFRIVANLATQPGARTMALDPGSHYLYLSAASYGPAPQPTAAVPMPRAPVLPGSFEVLVVAPTSR